MEVIQHENAGMEELTGFYREKPGKTIIGLYKGHYLKLIKSLICFCIKHLPVWVLPIATTNVINIIASNQEGQFNRILMNVGLVVVLVCVNIPMNVLYVRYISLAVREIESDIRLNLTKKLQALTMSYHKHLQAGRMQSKILRDVEAVSSLSMQLNNICVPVILNLVVTFAITLSKSKTVAIFYACSVPICFLLLKVFKGGIRKTNTDFRKNIEEMSATTAQMIEMVPVTRAHALEEVEISRMDTKIKRVKKTGHHIDILNGLFGACTWSTFQLLQIGCLLFTGYLAYNHKIQIGDIILYQSYFGTILGQVSTVINIYPEIIKGIESINSLGEVFLSTEVETYEDKKEVCDIQGNFKFENVSFKYEDGEEDVLEDFNLEVKEGENIAFVGESGGGKTTLLNLLIGFIKPVKGKMYLDGQDMSQMNMQQYREQIAVVLQNTILFSGTIRENITYGIPNVTEEQLQQAIEAAYLTDVIKNLPKGVDTLIGEHGDMLSGGQRQRIAIARALIRNPKVIIFDEATSALDNQSELHIQKAMKTLSKGRTTFVVAHRLSTIEDCDRIVVVDNGKASEVGTYDELIEQKGIFYKLATSKKVG